MSLSFGVTLGQYKIVAPIGAGGMGEVYRALDTRLDREVAIKVLPAALAGDPDRMARFEREAKVLASLNHPNIAQIYGMVESPDAALVMELVPGQTLQGPLPLEEALRIAVQVAEGLEAAHEKGIIHRDLKPGNIMITPEGVAKVLDFGLAAIAQPASGENPANSPTLTMSATQAGVIMGTAAYMAPEQAVGKPVDKRADIWAFGVVLLEMLTGKPLFHGETVSHVLADVIRAEIDFKHLPPATPPAIRDLLRRCLERDVKNRLRDIGEARVAIRKQLANPVSEAVAAVSSPKATRWPWAVACAAIVGACTWSWFQQPTVVATAVYNLEVSPPQGESIYQDGPSGIQAISPDGRTLAFIAGSNGTRHIWLRPLDSPGARLLSGTELADGMFWSPDSRHLGFMAGNKLYRTDLATGAIKELCDAGLSPRGASWNAEGVILFASVSGPMRRMPADGGAPVPVNVLDRSEVNNMYPQFLPDGKRFLYWSRGVSTDLSGVYAGTLELPPDRQPRKRVLASPSSALYASTPGASSGYLVFRQGTSVFAQFFDWRNLTVAGSPHLIADRVGMRGGQSQYSVSASGVLATAPAGDLNRALSIVSAQGEVLSTVGKPDAYSTLRLSHDGRSVALTINLPNSAIEIWLMDLAHGTPVPFTNNAGASIYPVWSPRGDELWYSVFRDGRYRMYRKPVSGNSREELAAPSDAIQLPGDLIDNPPSIVYWQRPADTIEVLPLTAGGKPAVIDDSRAAKFGVRVSPSRRWVAYTSNESGAFEVFVRSLPEGGRPAGPKIRISTGGGANAAWSADGNTLFYNSPDDRLYSAKLTISGDRLECGEPQPMFLLGGSAGFNGAIYWEPIGNGERFLVLRSAPTTARDNRIDVILNWQSGLTK
jgi:Tol biopolymer transport system component